MEPQRRILIVAYDFPPIASAGMVRVVNMVRHLRKHDWDVTVLTVRDSFVRKSREDMTLIPDGVEVVRSRTFELSIAAARLHARAGALRDGARASGWRRALGGPLQLLARLLSSAERTVLWPDRKVGWFVPLFVTALRLSRRSYDVVLTSSPPHSTHIPMMLLRAFLRFPWVVDFRDPWTTPARGPRVDRLQRGLEARVLARADAVIANTPGNRKALLSTFPGLTDEKVTVITNGFDTDLLGGGDDDRAMLDCDMVYTGHIYPRMLDPFLRGLECLRHRGAALPTVWVYGAPPRQLDVDDEVRDRVVFKERVSFVESLSVMRAAPALLFLVPHGSGFETWVPSKLYPYLFSGRPVFALVPEGDAARIIEETGAGTAVRSQDAEGVADALMRFMETTRRAELRSRSDSRLSPYAWETLGKRLDALLRAQPARV